MWKSAKGKPVSHWFKNDDGRPACNVKVYQTEELVPDGRDKCGRCKAWLRSRGIKDVSPPRT